MRIGHAMIGAGFNFRVTNQRERNVSQRDNQRDSQIADVIISIHFNNTSTDTGKQKEFEKILTSR